ncbi:MAG: hypothetical protein IKL46_03235 [Clostridia bacterium]|nr:hypothetical protein [Clostridia bacterium]
MTDKNSVSSQPPFTFWCKFPAATIDCNEYICPFQSGRGCAKVEKNASFPWLHFENNIYNHFTPYANWFTWKYYLKAAIDGDATYRPLENEMGTFIGAYSSNCYKIINEKFVKMKDIMAIE